MRIKQGFTLRTIGGEHIVVGEGMRQVNFNKLIAHNQSAAWLWMSIEDSDFDAEKLAALLSERYGIAEETALVDARDLIGQWIEAGVVEE